MTSPGDPGVSAAQTLVDIYDRAVPQLYGYFLPRCSSASLAEELTAETFMGAVTAVNRNSATEVSVAWLIGIARHKLVDHWRHVERERRSLEVLAGDSEDADDPWEAHLDASLAHVALARLSATQRAALTLRYLDGLSVGEVADHLGHTFRGTETLLVRARTAFRRAYQEGRSDDE